MAHISAQPSESNILEWHYLIHGPPSSPYHNGLYHGKLVFPRDYPYRPPAIYMITPNGRFKTNTKLCLSMSDFHPETWNPLWSVSSILQGLLSFMIEGHRHVSQTHTARSRRLVGEDVDDERVVALRCMAVSSTANHILIGVTCSLTRSPVLLIAMFRYGSMESSSSVREELARRSEEWNVDNDTMFNTLWPEYKEKVSTRRKQEKEQKANKKTTGEAEEPADTKPPTNTTKGEEAPKQETKLDQRNEGGGGGGNHRGGGGGRLPLGMDKLMATIALASVAFGVVVLYTYH